MDENQKISDQQTTLYEEGIKKLRDDLNIIRIVKNLRLLNNLIKY